MFREILFATSLALFCLGGFGTLVTFCAIYLNRENH